MYCREWLTGFSKRKKQRRAEAEKCCPYKLIYPLLKTLIAALPCCRQAAEKAKKLRQEERAEARSLVPSCAGSRAKTHYSEFPLQRRARQREQLDLDRYETLSEASDAEEGTREGSGRVVYSMAGDLVATVTMRPVSLHSDECVFFSSHRLNSCIWVFLCISECAN